MDAAAKHAAREKSQQDDRDDGGDEGSEQAEDGAAMKHRETPIAAAIVDDRRETGLF